MNTKLQELTEKLYSEGIENAQKESKEILSKAKKEAESVLQQAQKEKERILMEAENEADRFRKNVESELKMASRQLVGSLKERVQRLIQEETVENPIKAGLKDKDILLSVLDKTVSSIKANGSNVEIKLSESDKTSIEKAIQEGKASSLSEGVTLQLDPSLQGGFKIKPENGNYLISFTDEDFNQFFSSFLREQTVKFLEEGVNE